MKNLIKKNNKQIYTLNFNNLNNKIIIKKHIIKLNLKIKYQSLM